MKTALFAAGAIFLSSLGLTSQANAKDIGFSLTLGGPSGAISVSSPGPQNYNPYGYSGGYTGPYYGDSYKGPYYGGDYKGPYYGDRYRGPNYGNYPYYGGPSYSYQRRPRQCVGPKRVRKILRRQGWHSMHIKKLTPNIAVLAASRDGWRYRIKFDRCTCEIIRVSPKGAFY